MHKQCLIVDDEKPLAESTAEYFNLFDISALALFSAEECLNYFKDNTADLILLDINLEKSSGFDLCRTLRTTTQIPILFISARQSDDDVLLALNIGGDDYISKPYSLSVLLAKVKAVLKRCSRKQAVYSCGRLTVDFAAQKVLVNGTQIRLKAQEYRLLCYLIENRGKACPKEELFSKVWGSSITGDGTLNVHIRHLREKIEENPNEPRLILTLWGVGYIFQDEKG